jgi:MFS family permease
MTDAAPRWRAPLGVLAAAFLFNLGQGVLRPAMPLYLQQVFAARYAMVTLIPAAFGAGKWVASLPTGYLMERLGRRPLMAGGLVLIALADIASIMVARFAVFLALRALAGVGWAIFATAATTTMVDGPAASRRARAVSVLMMSETVGLLAGSAAGGWLYQDLGTTSPFTFEAACMLVAALLVTRWTSPGNAAPVSRAITSGRAALRTVVGSPGVLLMGVTSAALVAIQTGLIVFLVPLYLVNVGHLAPGAVGLIVSLGVVGRLAALWLGGGVSDRAGRVRVLVPGLLAYAALLGGLTLLTEPIALAAWSLAAGGVAGLVAPLPTALIADEVPSALRGVAIGWLRTLGDVGQVLGPLSMGALADAAGLPSAFIAGAALLGVVAWRCGRQAGAP